TFVAGALDVQLFQDAVFQDGDPAFLRLEDVNQHLFFHRYPSASGGGISSCSSSRLRSRTAPASRRSRNPSNAATSPGPAVPLGVNHRSISRVSSPTCKSLRNGRKLTRRRGDRGRSTQHSGAARIAATFSISSGTRSGGTGKR